jgi:hypothetical protein
MQVCMQSAIVCQSRGQSSLSNLRRKNGVRTLSTGSIREGSKIKTFEHLENFPSLGEQRSLGGGAIAIVRSTAGRDMDRHIGV